MKLLALLTLTSLSSLTAAAAIGGVTTTDSDSDADSASNLQSRADDGFGPLGKSDKLLLSCGRLCFGPRECGDLCPYCNPRTHNCEGEFPSFHVQALAG